MSSQPSEVKGKGRRKSAKPENVFDGVLNPNELLELLSAVGTNEIQLLCDGRSEAEKNALTDDQKRRLRQEAADEIKGILPLQCEFTYLNRQQVSLAEAYYLVLVGDEKVRNLQFAIKTLMAMLRDPRVPQKHKTKGASVAIRLAIGAALEAQAEEFQRNLERLPGLVDEFYQARDKANVAGMEKIVNLLAMPYFRGPLVEYHECGSASNLRFWFDSLQAEIDAVKVARG